MFGNADTAPVTQASVLANAMSNDGDDIFRTSRYTIKWLRLLDIVFALLVNTSRYDIAIVQFYSGNSFIWQYIAAHIVKMLGKKLVFTIHGGRVPQKLTSDIGNRYKKLLQKADIITVPSIHMEQELKKHGLATVLIENIIDLKQYHFQDKKQINPLLFWMRAFSDIYNPIMAVRVVNELKKKYHNVKMVMGGHDLGMLDETKKLIDELKLESHIEIVGFLNMNMKQHYASQYDVYISTNKVDNAPVTFLEMWAMGLPVVSTDVGGVKYLLDNEITGLIVKDGDYIEMASAVDRLIEDRSLTQSIIQQSRMKVLNYDEEVVVKKWAELLNSIDK